MKIHHNIPHLIPQLEIDDAVCRKHCTCCIHLVPRQVHILIKKVNPKDEPDPSGFVQVLQTLPNIRLWHRDQFVCTAAPNSEDNRP